MIYSLDHDLFQPWAMLRSLVQSIVTKNPGLCFKILAHQNKS